MYNTRLGILLEVICFGIGLLYRNKQAIEDLKEKYRPIPVRVESKFLTQLQEVFTGNISDETFNVPRMCQELGLSRTVLYQKVKTATGKTPVLYLRDLRLEAGRKLLMTTNQNISEIAYSVGFKDPNYFTRTFTNEFGVSPKRMRAGT